MALILILLLTALIAFTIFVVWQFVAASPPAKSEYGTFVDEKADQSNPYQDIEPLKDFDWSKREPIKIRPFKPKFHLTMALENCPLSELVDVDETYLERLKLRKAVMDENEKAVYDCHPSCESAVFEFYEWMMGIYLPRRYPTMYRLTASSQVPPDFKIDGPCLYNNSANRYIPLKASSAKEALYILGENVDDDFLLLLPSSTAEDGNPIYHLQAYVCCFPSGFSLPAKFGLPLAGIHKPVPGYKAKLEKSMDRFFAKMETGKAVRRANWAITTNDLLYSQDGNHLYSKHDAKDGHLSEEPSPNPPNGENAKTLDPYAAGLEEDIERQKREVDVEKCRLRCERQTLHRLEKTQALVFAFKTYHYKLEDVKAEGSGPALAEAIEGLDKGSVPEMKYYKRGVVWGEKVIEYLRN